MNDLPKPISEMAKELAIAAELDRIEKEEKNEAELEANLTGFQASISAPLKWGARLTAFFRQKWNGSEREAGARIEKKF